MTRPIRPTHVHRLTLKAPGTRAQLFERVCKLHESRLVRSRPLWELYVIDGIEGGKVALYGKVHHGIIDGRTFVQVVSAWLATSPKQRTVHAMWEGVAQRSRASEPRASFAARVQRALGQAAGTATSVVSLSKMLGEQGLKKLGIGGGNGLSLPFLGVPRALTGLPIAKRVYAYCALPLDELKSYAKQWDAKVNDVLLATLDIAIDRYLQEHGRRPKKALVAAMPVALADARGGNQIAVLQFPLGAPGKSPAARLADILKQTAKVKGVVQRATSETVMLYTTLVHGLPALLEKLGVKGGLRVSNLLVSNPFGLPEKRYLMGAEVELVLPISVVAAGQMLNVTAVTLADRLQLGFLGMPGAVPHIEKLAAYTVDAFEQLKLAIAISAAPRPQKRRAPVARRVARKSRKSPARASARR